jgi:hypothetical protein
MSAGAAATPIFITCRDRVTGLIQLVDWLERAGHERIYLVDNHSAWPALLEYLDQTPHTVVRLRENAGHTAPWAAGAVEKYAPAERYVVTDPDVVPDEDCPLDAIEHLASIIDRYPIYRKVGLGLRIDDLPAHNALRDVVIAWESQFWMRKVRSGLYHAPVDTTFAIYEARCGHQTTPTARTGAPYVARHLPWYADSNAIDEEERFYRARGRPGISNWHSDSMAREPRGMPIGGTPRWLLWKWYHVAGPFDRPRRTREG